MSTASLTRQRLRLWWKIIALACVVAPIFNLVTDEISFDSAAQGFVDGLFTAILVGGWVLFVREAGLRAWFRRSSFRTNLLVNGSVLLVLFLVARAAGNTLTSGDPWRFVTSFADPHLLFALPFFVLVVFSFQFVLQMSRMIGTNVLLYFLAGRYHRPRREERVFLFLDLVGSTRLTERLGSERYYALLRRFVDDLSEPVVTTGGEIYQYAGDEVVITWILERGIRDASCVRCFFSIADAIERGASAYERDFGDVPRFRGGLHGGEVVAGELGDIKQEIVFVGDILNTAARLEEHAKVRGERLVVSGSLLERLTLPDGLRARFLEELTPRGQEQTLGVYALETEGS